MSQQQHVNDFADDDEEDDEPQGGQQQRRENADLRQLRKDAKRAKQLENELAELRRERALEKAGLKTAAGNDLSERQIKALLATHEGEMTAEALRATAADLGFVPLSAEEQQLAADLGAQERIAAAAAGGAPAPTGVVTPTDVEEWSTEKILRFRQKYPEEFEALKRGEEVVGVSF